MLKIKRNAPKAKGEIARKKWPFADMRVNDVVDVTQQSEWTPARRASHAYGDSQKPKWQFQCQWLKQEKVGRIRRMA